MSLSVGHHYGVNDLLADAYLQRWIAEIRSLPAEAPPLDVKELRAPRTRSEGPSLPVVRDLSLPGDPALRLRLYRPGTGPLPLIVYVHGGSFIFGDLDSHDRTCRRLAVEANAAVLAVDYRRAPEHPAPAAIDDVAGVVKWALEASVVLGATSGSLSLAGDSAGGLIALMAAQRTIAASRPVTALLLICPNADLTLAQPSIQEKGLGWGLDTGALAWAVDQWVPEISAQKLADFSPLHTAFSGLPTTVIATAECDPLRDEGVALAAQLIASGIDARHLPHRGLVHGFLSLDDVSPAALEAGNSLMRTFGAIIRGNEPHVPRRSPETRL